MSVIDQLSSELARLPGIGPKTALRLVHYLMKGSKHDIHRLSKLVVELAEKIIGKLNSSSSISFADYRDVYGVDFEDMQRRIPNLDRINEIIGYVAAVDLDQCIDNVAAFHMKNGNNGQ